MSIDVLDPHTGLTQMTCDLCAIQCSTVFDATVAHQPHFDPVEEIEWSRNAAGDTVCYDCARRVPRERSTIGIDPARCLEAVGGGGTITDQQGRVQDVCPECFEASQKGDENMTTTNGTTEGTKQHPEKIIKRTKNMGTPLSNKEKAEKGELVAHLVQRIVEKKEARKNAGAQLKAEIDELDAELKRVSLEISCGTVFRDVQIFEKHVYRTGVYQEVRVDTGEVILERALTEKERQLEVPLGSGVDEDDSEDEPTSGPTNWTPDETDDPNICADTSPPSEPPPLPDLGPEPELETAKGKGKGKGKGGRKGRRPATPGVGA